MSEEMNSRLPYGPTDDEAKDLTRRFTYHAPKPDQPERYTALRNDAHVLAIKVCASCPPGRERSLAITKLEEAAFWANAAIARGESGAQE